MVNVELDGGRLKVKLLEISCLSELIDLLDDAVEPGRGLDEKRRERRQRKSLREFEARDAHAPARQTPQTLVILVLQPVWFRLGASGGGGAVEEEAGLGFDGGVKVVEGLEEIFGEEIRRAVSPDSYAVSEIYKDFRYFCGQADAWVFEHRPDRCWSLQKSIIKSGSRKVYREGHILKTNLGWVLLKKQI